MRTGVLIDARMTAPALPRKVLTDLAGWPMLYRVVERARAAGCVDEVAVATSRQPVDDPIAHFCDEFGVPFFRGSPDDVLGRHAQAAAALGFDVIVNVAVNGPLLDPALIGQVFRARARARCHYASNTLERTYPRGFDVEVITRSALEHAAAEAQGPADRASATAYVVGHPERFSLHAVRHAQDLSAIRWCVEGPADVDFVRDVYRRCGAVPGGLESLLALIEAEGARMTVRMAPAVEMGRTSASDDPFDFRGAP